MSKPEILIPDPLPPLAMEGISKAFETHYLWEKKDRQAFLEEVKSKIRGIACGHPTVMDAAFIDVFPGLEIIGSLGVGYDSIDAVHAASRGIIVTNTPDVLSDEVADTAIGLMIMTARELSAAERWLRDGKWANAPYPLTRGTLRKKKLGILGLGRIGKAIAARAAAMGMEIHYHNRNRLPDVPYGYFSSLEELATRCDVLMAVAPGGSSTHHIINAEIFRALGPDGIFINVGRGSVVDESALIAALQNKTIMSAGLDVFENEPHVPQALVDLDQVVLLPHVASASIDTRNAMAQLQVDNLVQWFSSGAPISPVAETPWPQSPAVS